MVSAEETEKLIRTHQIDYLDLGVAKDMALLSNAQYAVYGSFSQAGESISLDTRLVDAHEIKEPKPFFVTKDGLINILTAVDELAARLQSGMLQQDRIASIDVRGNKILDDDVALMRMKIRPGDLYDPKAVNAEPTQIGRASCRERV